MLSAYCSYSQPLSGVSVATCTHTVNFPAPTPVRTRLARLPRSLHRFVLDLSTSPLLHQFVFDLSTSRLVLDLSTSRLPCSYCLYSTCRLPDFPARTDTRLVDFRARTPVRYSTCRLPGFLACTDTRLVKDMALSRRRRKYNEVSLFKLLYTDCDVY